MTTSAPSKSKTTRKPLRRLTRSDIYFLIFVIAWTIVSLTISQTLVAILLQLIAGPAITQPLWTLVFYVLRYALTLASIIILPPYLWRLVRHRRLSKKSRSTEDLESTLATTSDELGVGKWPSFIDIGLAPIGYVVYIIFASILTNVMSLVFAWFNAEQAQDVGFSYFLTTTDRILAMFAIVFVAPIAEELIMRGWLYGKLRSKLGVVVSILITSFIFALLHGQWNVGVSVFVLSIVLCALREITGTIWSGMLLHIISNGIAFYIVYVSGGILWSKLVGLWWKLYCMIWTLRLRII